MSFKIFSHKLTARKQKENTAPDFVQNCSKYPPHPLICQKKHVKTRYRVLKPKGVGAPPTSPNAPQFRLESYARQRAFNFDNAEAPAEIECPLSII